MDDEYSSPNRASYDAEKKTEGKVLLGRCLLLFLYISLGIGFFTVCYINALIPVVAVLPMLLWILVFFTWRYVSYDTGYIFAAGTMTFHRIYGRRSKRITKDFLTVQVKNASYIGRWNSARREDEMRRVKKVYDFSSSRANPDAAVIVFTDKDGLECAVRFDCIRKAATLLRSFCPRTDLSAEDFSI